MTKHSDDFLRLANDARQRITEVSPGEARERVAEGALLLDVRDREEFESGHIDGATNISRGTLEMRIGEVAPDKRLSSATVGAATGARWQLKPCRRWATPG